MDLSLRDSDSQLPNAEGEQDEVCLCPSLLFVHTLMRTSISGTHRYGRLNFGRVPGADRREAPAVDAPARTRRDAHTRPFRIPRWWHLKGPSRAHMQQAGTRSRVGKAESSGGSTRKDRSSRRRRLKDGAEGIAVSPGRSKGFPPPKTRGALLTLSRSSAARSTTAVPACRCDLHWLRLLRPAGAMSAPSLAIQGASSDQAERAETPASPPELGVSSPGWRSAAANGVGILPPRQKGGCRPAGCVAIARGGAPRWDEDG